METAELSTIEQTAPLEAKEAKEEARRIEWEENHFAIQDAIIALRDKLKRFPKLAELKAETNLSIATIERHISSLKTQTGRFEAFRALTDKVAMALYDGATVDRDPKCIKLWYQIVEEWEERKRVTTRNESPFTDLSDAELDRQLAETEGKAPPAPTPTPTPIAPPLERSDGSPF